MELTDHQLDELTEIQFNLNTSELDEAIGQLRPEALLELRQDCLDSIDRQTGILARIQNRLAQN